ncbi:Uncharacterized protein TCM_020250 [Theobroma cacao]|uniref:Uncharacterized protein n=1 Tax=Theobroma cacao TaxID=3641 RepID=A0A061ELF7_THECC|nr:Uncharacterized protein TCM_020250 [Theobroma cacao]
MSDSEFVKLQLNQFMEANTWRYVQQSFVVNQQRSHQSLTLNRVIKKKGLLFSGVLERRSSGVLCDGLSCIHTAPSILQCSSLRFLILQRSNSMVTRHQFCW